MNVSVYALDANSVSSKNQKKDANMSGTAKKCQAQQKNMTGTAKKMLDTVDGCECLVLAREQYAEVSICC